MYPLLAALERAAEGAYLVDADHRIVYWNPAAEQLLGYSAQEVLGKPCYQVIPGLERDNRPWCRPRCPVWAAAQQERPVDSFRIVAPTKAGALRWLSFTILVVPLDQNGGSPLMLHLFRDVTEEQERAAFVEQVLSLAERFHLTPQAAPSAPKRPASGLDFNLTERERDVLNLLARGCSTEEIAEALSISVFTVRNHIQNILHKLQVRSRSAAVALAFEHNLVSGESPR